MIASLQSCFIALLVFYFKCAIANTPLYGQLETLSLSSDHILSRSVYDLSNLSVNPVDFLYTLNLLPEPVSVPESLSAEISLACIDLPVRADSYDDKRSVSHTVVCIAQEGYTLAGEPAIETTENSTPACYTNTVNTDSSVKIALKTCDLNQSSSATKYTALTEESHSYSDQPFTGSKHQQLHDALLASGALEYTKKGKGEQGSRPLLPPAIQDILFNQELLVPEQSVTVYMFRTRPDQGGGQAEGGSSRTVSGGLAQDIRDDLEHRQSATLPVLRLRQPPRSEDYLSEENIQRVIRSSTDLETRTDAELMSIAVDLKRIDVAIKDDEENERPARVDAATHVELMILENRVQKTGRDRHSEAIRKLFSTVDRLDWSNALTQEELSGLHGNACELSDIIEYFGSIDDQLRYKRYFSETKLRLQSVSAQKAREVAYELIRNFNNSPEAHSQINTGTLMLFGNLASELNDRLWADQNQEALIQVRDDLFGLAKILEQMSSQPDEFPRLQQSEGSDNREIIQRLSNDVGFSLRHVQLLMGQNSLIQARLRQLESLGLSGHIEPNVISAMSDEDFAAMVSILNDGPVDQGLIDRASFDLTLGDKPLTQRDHGTNIVRTYENSEWEEIQNSRTGAILYEGSSDEVSEVIRRAGDVNEVERQKVMKQQHERWMELTKKPGSGNGR